MVQTVSATPDRVAIQQAAFGFTRWGHSASDTLAGPKSNQSENKAIKAMDWVKEKMHKARLQRNRIQAQGAVTDPGNSLRRDSDDTTNRHSKYFSVPHKLTWLAAGMALGSVTVIMVWTTGLVGVSDSLRVSGISGVMPEQHRGYVELSSQFSTTDTEGLRNDIAMLTEQVQALTTSVSDLKIKLQSIHAVTDSIAALGNEPASGASQQPGAVSDTMAQLETLPSSAAGSGNVSVSNVKDTGKLRDASSTSLAAVNSITPTVRGKQIQEAIIGDGPWVINLASLPRKSDAERFMEMAQSRDVKAGLYQVTVKGIDYWRVEVSGYSTAAEAKSEATLIKEKLGLKDVWIAKR